MEDFRWYKYNNAEDNNNHCLWAFGNKRMIFFTDKGKKEPAGWREGYLLTTRVTSIEALIIAQTHGLISALPFLKQLCQQEQIL